GHGDPAQRRRAQGRRGDGGAAPDFRTARAGARPVLFRRVEVAEPRLPVRAAAVGRGRSAAGRAGQPGGGGGALGGEGAEAGVGGGGGTTIESGGADGGGPGGASRRRAGTARRLGQPEGGDRAEPLGRSDAGGVLLRAAGGCRRAPAGGAGGAAAGGGA